MKAILSENNTIRQKLLVHLHLYYHEQLNFMLEKLGNICDCDWDLVVTTCIENEESNKRILNFKPDAKIILVDNRGYDVWPFIQVLQQVNIDNYDFVLKIHTKNYYSQKVGLNGYSLLGFDWRNSLISALIGTKEVFKNNIKMLRSNLNIGMIADKNCYIRFPNDKIDIKLLQGLKQRLHLTSNFQKFIAGTMFFISVNALYPLIEHHFLEDEFPLYGHSSTSHTLAHSIERIFVILVKKNKQKIHLVRSLKLKRSFRLFSFLKKMQVFKKTQKIKNNTIIKRYKFCGLSMLRKEISATETKWKVLGIKVSRKIKNTFKDIITIDKEYLISNLWNVYKKLDIRVDNERHKFVNIIIPNLIPKMSAGPLSIIWMGKKLADLGYNIRFLPITLDGQENPSFIIASQEEGLEEFAKQVIVDYSIPLNRPIYISYNDMTIATLFSTAYYAQQIQEKCADHKFIYMIQDYERDFFSGSSMGFISENTYNMDYYALFSSKFLENFFIQKNIGGLKTRKINHISYLCPCNCFLPSKDNFINNRKPKKQFVFYARPHTDRNAYDLSAYVIIQAVEKGILNPEDWEFFGIGSQYRMRINLGNGCYLNQMPNMSLNEYKKMLPYFDVMLSLMASPHHSMPPIDAALSGCVVVTNSSDIKTQSEFNKICRNIIACPPDVESLLNGINRAVAFSDNLENRYKNALVEYPNSMANALNQHHDSWFKDILK